MDDITSGALVSDPETRRALQLDALSAILPMERRDRLAELLTDDDVATLKHLAQEGMGENTLRALASDLAYLEAWAQAATGAALPWPASESLALKFVAHHLWDPARRETDPQHGMPADVAAALRESDMLRSTGPHAPSTVKRRLASWGTLHRWKGQEGPFASPSLRSALRLAVRASTRPRRRKSKRAVTRDVLDRLLATCSSDRLADTRDLAILLLAFASGGRRRSEVARLRVAQLSDEPLVPLDPLDPKSPTLPCVAIQLGRTKTGNADDEGEGAAGWPAGRGAARMAGAGGHHERSGVPRHRSLGSDRGEGADPPVDQPNRQAAVRDGGARCEGVFRARLEVRVSDGGGATRRFLAGGDAAIPAPFCAAGSQLLQRSGSTTRSSRTARRLNRRRGPEASLKFGLLRGGKG
jgi:hypothetical protein